MQELLNWGLEQAGSPMGILALYLLTFAECAFLPFPSDILMMACAMSARNTGSSTDTILLALVATAGSVLGCAFGYLLGFKGGKPLLQKLVSREKIAAVHQTYEKYEVWTLGLAGFSPFPYSIFTISAGVFYIKFTTFILVSTLSRGLRFMLEALLIYYLGRPIMIAIQEHYGWFSVAIVIILAGGIFYFNRRQQ